MIANGEWQKEEEDEKKRTQKWRQEKEVKVLFLEFYLPQLRDACPSGQTTNEMEKTRWDRVFPRSIFIVSIDKIIIMPFNLIPSVSLQLAIYRSHSHASLSTDLYAGVLWFIRYFIRAIHFGGFHVIFGLHCDNDSNTL